MATVAPPAGAGAVSVTVARNDVPPTTVARSSVSVASEGAGAGVTVSTALLLLPLYAAEIVADVSVATVDVVIPKFAAVVPGATEPLAGTAMALLALDSATSAPPAGAAAVSVTVPVADCPPTTLAGLVLSEPT